MSFLTLAPLNTVLEDLTSRFIINVPVEELSSIERVIFQIEQAHWFYEDFIRSDLNPKLPSTSLKNFSLLLFQSCSLLRHWVNEHERAFNTFLDYKVRVPVCGAIILNPEMTKVLLVRGWKANSTWGFPRGKINQNESESTCASREVMEEVGFDCSNHLNEDLLIEKVIYEQKITLYIILDVDESIEFVTRTRKEIGAIKWHSLNSLPGYAKNDQDQNETHSKNKKFKFYMITPFTNPLKKIIERLRNNRKNTSSAVPMEMSNLISSAANSYQQMPTYFDNQNQNFITSTHCNNLNFRQLELHQQQGYPPNFSAPNPMQPVYTQSNPSQYHMPMNHVDFGNYIVPSPSIYQDSIENEMTNIDMRKTVDVNSIKALESNPEKSSLLDILFTNSKINSESIKMEESSESSLKKNSDKRRKKSEKTQPEFGKVQIMKRDINEGKGEKKAKDDVQREETTEEIGKVIPVLKIDKGHKPNQLILPKESAGSSDVGLQRALSGLELTPIQLPSPLNDANLNSALSGNSNNQVSTTSAILDNIPKIVDAHDDIELKTSEKSDKDYLLSILLNG